MDCSTTISSKSTISGGNNMRFRLRKKTIYLDNEYANIVAKFYEEAAKIDSDYEDGLNATPSKRQLYRSTMHNLKKGDAVTVLRADRTNSLNCYDYIWLDEMDDLIGKELIVDYTYYGNVSVQACRKQGNGTGYIPTSTYVVPFYVLGLIERGRYAHRT
jgi:hypothetical protein